VRALLVSTYDLGRQSFEMGSAAAWLREVADVRALDLALEPLDEAAVRAADLVAFHVPMHTATRLAAGRLTAVRRLAPHAHVCCFGLYAPLNAAHLVALGAHSVLGAEFEPDLAALARAVARQVARGAPAAEAPARIESAAAPPARLEPWVPRVPDRSALPPLERYARLDAGDGRLCVTGCTLTTRGCRHRCRHCPIVPVYGGRVRVIPLETVMADVRQQVAAGAEHVTFADPDFLNAPRHALRVAEALHAEAPGVTWDATVKVEHLVRHAELLPRLRAAGCLFVTTAVESFDDAVLARLAKGHTRADVEAVARLARGAGLALHPTFVAFHPWTTAEGYRDHLRTVEALDWVEHTASIQLGIRLLLPAGSWLLADPEVRALAGRFDAAALVHPWAHPDPALDALQRAVQDAVHAAAREGASRAATFERVTRLAEAAAGEVAPALARVARAPHRPPVPFLTEPWYC
jgi:pyruvate-formate lyase-activating enzyme